MGGRLRGQYIRGKGEAQGKCWWPHGWDCTTKQGTASQKAHTEVIKCSTEDQSPGDFASGLFSGILWAYARHLIPMECPLGNVPSW